MDSRGPQEARAPGDSLDSIFMGHNANLSSKNNNRLFFLTVYFHISIKIMSIVYPSYIFLS